MKIKGGKGIMSGFVSIALTIDISNPFRYLYSPIPERIL